MDSKETSGRVLWYDPNLANNTMVNPEDLSIKVEFTSFKKGRTIIYSGQEAKNSGGKDLTVGFIEGSKVNSTSAQPSLTTRYNDAIALEIMNNTTDKIDDYESLGIESIDIEFDTANTPLIKIKFIDVRGNAILSQGTMSKYRMFFELPYPIFSLKVKGFYGKTVNYCLHMLRWNASFNSDTGNFEIQADFMGYTYAMLTDILMGLVRAAVRTKAGQEKLKLKQAEYGENSNLVITIDEMLKSFVDLNNSLRKISADDDTASQIQTYPEIYSAITELEGEINTLSNAIYDGNPANNFFRSPNGDVLCVPSNSDTKDKYEKAFKVYKDKLTDLLKNINGKIDEGGFRLSETELKTIKATLGITKKEVIETNNDSTNGSNNINPIIQKTNGENQYSATDTGLKEINNLLETIGKLSASSATDSSPIDIYNLKPLYKEINYKRGLIQDNEKKKTTDFNNKLSETAIGTIGFEPTIRNIFRVLSINSEIFLEVLRDVSIAGQSNQNRTTEFKKLVASQANLNVHKADVDGGVIYAWPEYREKKDKEGFVETWLGSVKTINPNNINEVVFVEEMLKELVNVALFDKDLDKQIENAGLDIDAEPTTIKDAWYPLCTADTPVNDLLTENPYIKVSESGNADAVKRLILLRTFMSLGVSAFENKIIYKSGTKVNLLEVMGYLEAENIVEAARKKGQEGQTFIKDLINSKTADELVSNIITKIGLEGSDQITNPTGKKKPIMKRMDGNGVFSNESPTALDGIEYYYKYTYISDKKNTTYIPISGSFDGVDFYNNGKLKSNKELKNLSNSTLFISNPINSRYSKFRNVDNGSYLFKIYEKDQYLSKTMKPLFGSEKTIGIYKEISTPEPVLRVDSVYNAVINPKTKDETNKTLIGIEPLSGNYSALEISKLNYSYGTPDKFNYYMGEPKWKPDTAIDSSIIGFYTQFSEDDSGKRSVNFPNYGTYLSYVTPKIKDDEIIYDKGSEIYFKNKLRQNILYLYNRDSWSNNGYLKNKTLLSKYYNDGATLYLPFIEFGTTDRSDNIGNINLSLFGSYFYYIQDSDEARALLFLHSIPWQGVKNFGADLSEMLMFDKYTDWDNVEGGRNITRVLSLKAMFSVNSAFIHAPKAWVLFIGAMLWRAREGYKKNEFEQIFDLTPFDDPIKYVGKDGNKFTLIPNVKKPNGLQFLYVNNADITRIDKNVAEKNPWGLFFGGSPGDYTEELNTYTPIDKTLINLPKQVRDEFINYFENWVDDENGWQFIKNNLELFKGRKISDYDKWVGDCKKVKDVYEKKINDDKYKIDRKYLEELFTKEVTDNYELISSFKENATEGNLFTVLKPNTTVMDNLVSLLTTPVILQNNNPGIWHNDSNQTSVVNNLDSSNIIQVRSTEFKIYLKSLFEQLITLNETYSKEVIKTEEEEAKQEIFGTTDDKTIKLIIYRTLSSINDKWLNGELKGSVFSQCGSNAQNSKDLQYAKKFRGESADTSTLIDTFRFVDRAFADIGDKFYININSVTDLIRSDYNQSFFDVANKILTDNNFNFFTLPTFINFNNIDELSDVFTPFSYNNPITFNGTGPSFVCCYVGQTSTNLDLGVGSVYPDDGLSIHKDASGKFIISEGAEDFSEPIDSNTLDSLVPVFSVNYGQQNQNYFKNIKLDQREFTETMESLQTIEDISQGGDKSKATYRGNNLFNVYQTRSYSAEVEMLGAPMIQPMMYFQLNNIPMFRGAYLIYKVNHSIKPHSMITSFKGNRTKKTKTPLVDKATMLMNLVGTTEGGATNIRAAAGDPNAKPTSKFIDTNLQLYWLDSNGNIPTGKDTIGISNKNKTTPGLKRIYGEEGRVYLIREVAEVIQYAAKWFNKEHINEPNKPDTILYGELNKLWGGNVSGHKGHSNGLVGDFYQSRNDKKTTSNPKKCVDGEGDYSKEYTYKWVEKILQTPYRKYTIPSGFKKTLTYIDINNNSKKAKAGDTITDQRTISKIYFNDTKLQNEINSKFGKNLMATEPGHCNHLHLEFYTPLRVAVESELTTPSINSRQAVEANQDVPYGTRSTSEIEARKQMKVEKLPPGFDVKFKRIIINGNYAGINITNYENDWIAVASNYIARNETFKCCPKNDQGKLRAGFGTDRILVNGSLKIVTDDTVFTENVAKNTLVYQTKNSFAAPLEDNLGSSNWNKLNKYQRAALLSLTYNTGPSIFSEGYGKKIKDGIASGDFKEAAQGILDGPVTGSVDGYMDGLRKRRIQEARLFLLDKNEKVQYI